jgi:hypothetical protein
MRESARQNFAQMPWSWQIGTEKLGELWCSLMHDSSKWPIHGQYECRTCGRLYPVPWAGNDLPAEPSSRAGAGRVGVDAAQIGQTRVPFLRRAVLPLIAALSVLQPATVRAADTRFEHRRSAKC